MCSLSCPDRSYRRGGAFPLGRLVYGRSNGHANGKGNIMPEIRIVAKTPLSKGNRIVQRIGQNLVIKYGCPSSSMSGGQNKIEAASWERVKGTADARHFAPVLASAPDGSWLLMPYMEHDDGLTRDQRYDGVDTLQTVLDRQGLDSGDVHSGNWRMVGGVPKMIDYGYSWSKFRSKRFRCGTCKHCRIIDNGEKIYATGEY